MAFYHYSVFQVFYFILSYMSNKMCLIFIHSLLNPIVYATLIWMLWKTTPVNVNKFHKIQQNEIERIWGISTETSTRVISTITIILNPLLMSYKKYIYTGSYLCVFIRVRLMSSILVTPDFEHTVKCYPVSWFSWTLNIKWYIRALSFYICRLDWKTRLRHFTDWWTGSLEDYPLFLST